MEDIVDYRVQDGVVRKHIAHAHDANTPHTRIHFHTRMMSPRKDGK